MFPETGLQYFGIISMMAELAARNHLEFDTVSAEAARIIVVGKNKVMGMTILGGFLFVILEDPCDIVYKYDLEKTDQRTTIQIVGLKRPRGLASSSKERCLYITDWNELHSGRFWCCKFVDAELQTLRCREIAIDMRPYGVSARDFDIVKVLVTCKSFTKLGNLIMYQLRDGMDEIPDGKSNYVLEESYNPRHCVMGNSERVFICFGMVCHSTTRFGSNQHVWC